MIPTDHPSTCDDEQTITNTYVILTLQGTKPFRAITPKKSLPCSTLTCSNDIRVLLQPIGHAHAEHDGDAEREHVPGGRHVDVLCTGHADGEDHAEASDEHAADDRLRHEGEDCAELAEEGARHQHAAHQLPRVATRDLQRWHQVKEM